MFLKLFQFLHQGSQPWDQGFQEGFLHRGEDKGRDSLKEETGKPDECLITVISSRASHALIIRGSCEQADSDAEDLIGA